MPRFDGPYTILSIDEPHSTIKLDLPSSAKSTRMFHTSQVLPYHENDPSLFPSRSFPSPPPIITPLCVEEYLIRDIVDERRSGRGSKYLVRWVGYGDEENRWLPSRKELKDTKVLDIWLAQRKLTFCNYLLLVFMCQPVAFPTGFLTHPVVPFLAYASFYCCL